MFRCGMAKSLYDTSVDCIFDENIDIFFYDTRTDSKKFQKQKKKKKEGRNGNQASLINYKGNNT